jgi:hypothetical protein
MNTIRTSYPTTVSMSASRYARFQAKGESLQVVSFSGTTLGYVRPHSEYRTTATKHGLPIIVVQFERLVDRLTF